MVVVAMLETYADIGCDRPSPANAAQNTPRFLHHVFLVTFLPLTPFDKIDVRLSPPLPSPSCDFVLEEREVVKKGAGCQRVCVCVYSG